MSRLLLSLLLLACGDAGAQSIGGGAVGGGGSGAAADPTPVFDFDPGVHGSGPAQLTTDAFAMTTVVECDARTATTTNWVCGTGGTFTESEGDVTVGYAAPFTEAGARANDYDRFYAHRAPSTSVAEVGSGVDVSMILVARLTARGATQYVASKYDTANSKGWGIRVTAGDVVQGVANATTFGSYTLDTRGEWNIYELQCDSGATNGARLYVNGALVGSAANCPSDLTTVTVAKNFSFGCRPNGTNNDCIDGQIAYARVQTCTGCITSTADQDTIAQRHAMQIMGVWPTHAVVANPVLQTRATTAYIDVTRDADGQVKAYRRLFRVGQHWMRVGRRQEASGDGHSLRDGSWYQGFLAEPTATNLLLQSDTYGTTWTKLNAGDTVQSNPGVASPSEFDDNADRLEGNLDVVGVEHALRQTTASSLSAAYTYVFSVYAGYTDDGAVAFRYLWLRDNTIGATAIGWFDLKTCKAISAGSALKSFGTNFNQGTMGAVRTRHMGDTGVGGYRWCRAEIVVQGTTATHAFDIGASKTSGTTTQTTTAGERAMLLWGAQLERMAVAEGESSVNAGERSSSYIQTTTATVTRNGDTLRFHHSNWPSAGGTVVASYLLEDGRVANNVADYATARAISVVPCAIEKDANNVIQVEQTAEADTTKWGFGYLIRTAGTYQWDPPTLGVVDAQADHRDGRFHWVRAVAMPNDARIYLDGDTTSARTQTSVTLPTIDGGGIAIGYSHAFNVEWARGLIYRCTFYAGDVEVSNPSDP